MMPEEYVEAYLKPVTAGAPAPKAIPFLAEEHYYREDGRRHVFDTMSLDLLQGDELILALRDANIDEDITAAELRQQMATINRDVEKLWTMVMEKEEHIRNFQEIATRKENAIQNLLKEGKANLRHFEWMLSSKNRTIRDKDQQIGRLLPAVTADSSRRRLYYSRVRRFLGGVRRRSGADDKRGSGSA